MDRNSERAISFIVPSLNISEDLKNFLDKKGKDEFFFAMDALHELARYERIQPGQEFITRVKAEVDGNSNGATIQGYQMGVTELLKKGGVLYSDKRKKEKIGERLWLYQKK